MKAMLPVSDDYLPQGMPGRSLPAGFGGGAGGGNCPEAAAAQE